MTWMRLMRRRLLVGCWVWGMCVGLWRRSAARWTRRSRMPWRNDCEYIYTHTHTHTLTYMCMCACACVCIYVCGGLGKRSAARWTRRKIPWRNDCECVCVSICVSSKGHGDTPELPPPTLHSLPLSYTYTHTHTHTHTHPPKNKTDPRANSPSGTCTSSLRM